MTDTSAPLPSEADYGADPPPADQDPGLPAGIDIAQPATPDDDDGLYGHTQEVIEPKQPVLQTTTPVAGDGAPIRAAPLGLIDPQLIPQRRWLLGRRHLRDQVTETIGAGGAGKSVLSIEEGAALVTGDSITGMAVHETGPVWVYNTEDPIDELHRRVAAICQHWGINPHDLCEKFFLNSGIERPLIVAEEDKGEVISTPDVEGAIHEIRNKGIIQLTVDPLVRSHRVDENSNKKIDFVVEQFGKIAAATHCSVHLVHHTRKPPGATADGQAGNPHSARGASALVWAARVVDTLYGMTERDGTRYDIKAEERRLYVRLDRAKGNLSLGTGAPIWFKWQSVILPNGPGGTEGDSVGVLVPANLSNAERRAAQKAEDGREKFAHKVSLVLENGEAQSLTEIAKRLLAEGYCRESERTVRRRIKDAVPAATVGVKLEIEGQTIKLYRSVGGPSSTAPIIVRREDKR